MLENIGRKETADFLMHIEELGKTPALPQLLFNKAIGSIPLLGPNLLMDEIPPGAHLAATSPTVTVGLLPWGCPLPLYSLEATKPCVHVHFQLKNSMNQKGLETLEADPQIIF